MFFFLFPQLAEALKSDASFMDLLRQDAQARKNRVSGWRPSRDADGYGLDADRDYMIRDDFYFTSHPDVDTLHDYILDSLSDEKMREVMDHLSECEECARKVLEIRRLDKEITKDLRDWMKSPVTKSKGSCSDDPM